MLRTLGLIAALVLLGGCATYYQPRHADDGVYYGDDYGYDRRVVIYDDYPVNPVYYPYWSLDHFYFSHYWFPYSVVSYRGWTYPHYRYYPGWNYWPYAHQRVGFSFSVGFGYPWHRVGGYYSYYRPWYPKHHYRHHYREHVRGQVAAEYRGERGRHPRTDSLRPIATRDRAGRSGRQQVLSSSSRQTLQRRDPVGLERITPDRAGRITEQRSPRVRGGRMIDTSDQRLRPRNAVRDTSPVPVRRSSSPSRAEPANRPVRSERPRSQPSRPVRSEARPARRAERSSPRPSRRSPARDRDRR